MNKQSIAKLAAFLVLLLMGGVFLGIIISDYRLSTERIRITLPPETDTDRPSDSAPPAEPGDLTPVSVEIDVRNVQEVIRTLARPAAYTLEARTTLYAGDASLVTSVRCSLLHGFMRIERSRDGSETEIVILGGGQVFSWLSGNPHFYQGAAGDFDTDSTAGIPTYETVLALPVRQITAAAYRLLDGERCIYIKTLDDVTGYETEYWISVENGLLTQVSTTMSGTSVYEMHVTAVSLDSPAEDTLLLPTGIAVTDA